MQLTFLGATGTVTGSKYLLETGSKKILIDCGLFQGLKQLRLKNWESLPFNVGELDALVLTHAHIDHSGYIPALVRDGYRRTVFCTPATLDLCQILLPDSGYLQEEEARFANRHGYSKHRPALPLYTEEDAQRSLDGFLPIHFNHDVEIADGVMVRFRPAGHILGASTTQITTQGLSILFSGDLGRSDDILMNPPAPVESADYLVLESTYGDRLHDRRDPEETLAEIVNRTVQRNGTIIVPAFAVGRAQALLLLVQRLKKKGKIGDIPVYLNSPMAIDATDILRRYIGEHRLSEEECRELYRDVRLVRTMEESKDLNRRTGPMIIISASGMVTGGRVLHHIETFAPDPRNTILFTGYQGVGTRGAAILEGATEVKIHGVYVPIRAEIALIDSLSAHADYADILRWLGNFTSPPARTFLTHGEPVASDALRHRIEETMGWRCTVPEYQQQVPLVISERVSAERPTTPAASGDGHVG